MTEEVRESAAFGEHVEVVGSARVGAVATLYLACGHRCVVTFESEDVAHDAILRATAVEQCPQCSDIGRSAGVRYKRRRDTVRVLFGV
jgi:hypothetical protein